MKYDATTVLVLASLATAREVPLYRTTTKAMAKREVPQEHSHQAILDITNTNLQLDNPLEIQDAVFALLGNAAAAKGAPNVDNLDCLQQIVADQAFTNAKAAGDVDGQANAIMFRALERNTAAVGQESVLCDEQAVNPEIAAITQHQDPASAAGAAGNKQIALDVATQLAAIGADPTLAIQTGTFAPGDPNDNTGAGNTCDDATDPVGCIISQNLLVPDVTEDEINAAVGADGAGNGAADAADAAAASDKNSTASASGAAADCGSKRRRIRRHGHARRQAATGTNVQTFTGTLGGAAPAVISSSADPKRPFSVNGATFVNQGAALQRSCAVQNTACSNAANAGTIDAAVSDCNAQEAQCNNAANKKLRRAAAAALDFGSCDSPAISFGAQADRADADAFAAVDQADFNHGSALNIKVISDFVCQQLGSKCGAADDAVSACEDGAQAASGLEGQAAADAFNNALGVSA